jgi:2-oxo-4-hydroxy-4-carboxy--5-ureidoimidazoline (OHCU) decarboxylase
LATLLEPSSALTTLCTELIRTQEKLDPIESYRQLINVAFAQIASWPRDRKADFISGHPRIGETKQLSALSSKEQASQATPPDVLERLRVLNEAYERMFPGLRYITFVNGRTRAQIAEELDELLANKSGGSSGTTAVASTEAWTAELERAIRDVKAIALSRLGTAAGA